MGILDEDDDEDLDIDEEESLDDDEALGVQDADALAGMDLQDDGEDVGLDTEVGMRGDLGDLSNLIDGDDDSTSDPLANDPLEGFEGEHDDDEDEHSWTEDSEGAGDAFEGEALSDDEESHEDDGGLEGVEDSLLDDWEADLPPLSDDPDLEEGDTLVEDLGDDWLKDVANGR
jgi:hypothetical protein